ncbi:hypothetical protein E3P99_02153 [Wallemia hederae]|uniref:WW domain-containing protein n=1 Tax=Wallemia hederae TaxID=1540922 RepID=A0A4T0FLK2_9BASI|nr:hypothetical protein E3P99_02153 [Wallemia hederae]
MSSAEQMPLPVGWIREYDPNHQAYFYVDTHQTPAHVTWDDPRQNPLYANLVPTTHSGQPFTRADAPPSTQQQIKQRDVTNNWFEELSGTRNGSAAATPQSTTTPIKDVAAGALGALALSGVAFKHAAVKDAKSSHSLSAGWGSGLSN